MIAVVCTLIMLVLLVGDQLTKAWAEAVAIHQPDYFLGIIRWNFSKNTGMAFGIFDDNRTAMIVITALTVGMIIGIAVLFFTLFKKNKAAQIALAFIEAGAIGNLIDRLILTYVRDMVDVSPIGFGICNFADFYITGGAVALIIIIFFFGEDPVFPIGKRKKQTEDKNG